jgi:hypothetical protein
MDKKFYQNKEIIINKTGQTLKKSKFFSNVKNLFFKFITSQKASNSVVRVGAR